MSKSQLQYDTELDPPRLFYTGRRRIRKGRPELQMAVECPSLDGTFTVEWLKERVKDRRVVEAEPIDVSQLKTTPAPRHERNMLKQYTCDWGPGDRQNGNPEVQAYVHFLQGKLKWDQDCKLIEGDSREYVGARVSQLDEKQVSHHEQADELDEKHANTNHDDKQGVSADENCSLCQDLIALLKREKSRCQVLKRQLDEMESRGALQTKRRKIR